MNKEELKTKLEEFLRLQEKYTDESYEDAEMAHGDADDNLINIISLYASYTDTHEISDRIIDAYHDTKKYYA